MAATTAKETPISENTNLIKSTPKNTDNKSTDKLKKANKSFVFTKTKKEEFVIIFNQFVWITLQMLFEIVPGIFQMQLLGRLPNGSYYLSGVGLGRTFANVIGRAQAWGMTTALFTLLPQCIGANEYHLISQYIQRAFYITTTICFFLSFLQLFAGDILIAMGQSSDLRDLINLYCRVYIPNTFINVWLTIIQRIMQSLNYNRDIAITQFFSFAISYPLYYLLIYYLDLRAVGGALGAWILSLIMLIGCIMCLKYRGYGYVFRPLSLSIIMKKDKIMDYIWLSLPGLFQHAFEWIILEIATVLAGYIIYPQISISTTVIMGNLLGFVIAFCFGLGNSTNIRVGGYIGSRNIGKAKEAASIGIFLCVIVNIIFFILYFIFHGYIPYFWSDNELLANTASNVILYIMIPFNICCLTLQTFSGVYKGLALQKISATFVVIGYWFISFPLSLILLFAIKLRDNLQYGSYVIWGSLCLGNGLGAIACILYLIFYINWENAVEEAKKRMEEKQQNVPINSEIKSNYQAITQNDNNNDNNATNVDNSVSVESEIISIS